MDILPDSPFLENTLDTELLGIPQDMFFLGNRADMVFEDTHQDNGSLGNKVDTVTEDTQQDMEFQDSMEDMWASGGIWDIRNQGQLVSEW